MTYALMVDMTQSGPAPGLYVAPGLDPCVEIRDDGALLATLNEVMLGWQMSPAARGALDTLPAIRVEQGAEGWTCSGETYEKAVRFRDPVATACSVIASLYKAHTLANSDGLCLHAAGVRIGDGLVLLTGHYRAGKTVVTAACAAAGLQVFSDDIIPLSADARTAFAPGLAIRLRLPLPETLSSATRDFVETHRTASNQRYAYMRPPEELLARHGTATRVRAIVALNRRDEGPAMLSRLAAGDALRETVLRNFAREVSAARILDALDGLIGSIPCLKLSYALAEEAVVTLTSANFDSLAAAPAPAGPEPAGARDSKHPPLPPETSIRRAPGVLSRERGGQAFLTDAAETVIFNLNQTGSAVWRVIEQPVTFGELIQIFAAGFPEQSAEALAGDLSYLVRDMAGSGLAVLDECQVPPSGGMGSRP